VALIFKYPTMKWSCFYAAPLFLSSILPQMPQLAWPVFSYVFQPMKEYFEYEQILEAKPVNIDTEILRGVNYLFVLQPHGVFAFCAYCAALTMPPEFMGPWDFPCAVANAVLYLPIIKHISSVRHWVSASKPSMISILKKPGARGCLSLFVGGIAEMFLARDDVEQVFLKSRKGFVKLALQQGVDVIPVYMFGNTHALSALRSDLLFKLSRKLHFSIGYACGRWYLPVPRPTKMMWVRGQPLGMPRIEHPTQEEIDYWHNKYCMQVKRLFDTYKERVPEYKHKRLEIM
jgi:2-acylglycerol O-acyltransferase 2